MQLAVRSRIFYQRSSICGHHSNQPAVLLPQQANDRAVLTKGKLDEVDP